MKGDCQLPILFQKYFKAIMKVRSRGGDISVDWKGDRVSAYMGPHNSTAHSYIVMDFSFKFKYIF
jgi:hypothetical protein